MQTVPHGVSYGHEGFAVPEHFACPLEGPGSIVGAKAVETLVRGLVLGDPSVRGQSGDGPGRDEEMAGPSEGAEGDCSPMGEAEGPEPREESAKDGPAKGLGGAASRGLSLHWPGRKYRPSAPGRRGRGAGSTAETRSSVPLVTEERVGDGRHRFIIGGAADVADALLGEGLEGKVDLVYLDPPFASQSNYVHEARLDGRADGRVLRKRAYGDTWSQEEGGIAAYLEELGPCLDRFARLLSPRGTLWVHLDWRAAYLVRVLLDEILGREAFRNEVVWKRAPNLGRQAASGQFGRTLDTILVYGREKAVLVPPTRLEPIEPSAVRFDEEGRAFTSAPRGDYTDESIVKLEAEGRVHRSSTGKVYIKYFLTKNPDGSYSRERRVDTLWTDIPPLRHVAVTERTGFPTQKPRALLERILLSGTRPGDLVVDLFSGSGTTAEAAHALGRRAIAGDRGEVAFATARTRFLRAGMGFRVERLATMAPPSGLSPRVAFRPSSGRVQCELLEPREPLAWAVGLKEGGTFVPLWHGERSLGRKVVPPSPVAEVPWHGEPLWVRVYGDDGTLGEVGFPSHGEGQGAFSGEVTVP